MKNLKYILLTIITFIFTINVAEAKCIYGNETLNFTCEASGSNVYCTMSGTGANNYFLKDYSKVNISDTNTCTGIIMRTEGNPSTVITKPEVYLYSISEASKPDYTFKNPVNTALPATSIEQIDKDKEDEATLNNYNGKTCIYSNGAFLYTCTIINGKPSCKLKYAEGSPGSPNYHWNNTSINHTLKASDFLKNGKFTCPATSDDKLSICAIETKIDYTTAEYQFKEIGLTCSSSYKSMPPLTYSPNAKDDEGNPSHNNDKDNDATPTNPENPDDKSDKKDEKLDLDHFCQGKIQGVFTALGWVFFVIKILVPVILIVFGTIDLSKAVIASKDDEIKKSVKTLLIRVVAGIIIFFLPTILNMIVKTFNQNDVYNGTFMDCTSCMLDPTQDACATLMGGATK